MRRIRGRKPLPGFRSLSRLISRTPLRTWVSWTRLPWLSSRQFRQRWILPPSFVATPDLHWYRFQIKTLLFYQLGGNDCLLLSQLRAHFSIIVIVSVCPSSFGSVISLVVSTLTAHTGLGLFSRLYSWCGQLGLPNKALSLLSLWLRASALYRHPSKCNGPTWMHTESRFSIHYWL